MTFRPLDPLPTPDEVLSYLDPKPGEVTGYITRDDIRFGWLYFMSLAWGNLPVTVPTQTLVVPAWSVDASYLTGQTVRYASGIWIAAGDVAAQGLPPGQTVLWQRVDSRPTVTNSLVAGETPSTHTFDTIPVQGDVFINVPDSTTWMRGGGGWQKILIPMIPVRQYAEASIVLKNPAPAGWTNWDLTSTDPDTSGVVVTQAHGMMLNKDGIYTVTFLLDSSVGVTAQVRIDSSTIVASHVSSSGQVSISITKRFAAGTLLTPYAYFSVGTGTAGGTWSRFVVTYLGARAT